MNTISHVFSDIFVSTYSGNYTALFLASFFNNTLEDVILENSNFFSQFPMSQTQRTFGRLRECFLFSKWSVVIV